MTEPTLIIACVKDCLPGRNPRIVTADPMELDSDGLLTAIRAEGVKIPIHIRNHPKHRGKKEIMAGERRHKCCEVAGIETVRALDYGELPDDEAFKITLAENGPRRELTPIEQGRAAAYALELCGGDKKAAAALMGQTVRWIAMGARIHQGLIECWQKELLKGGLLRHWTAGHVALIARFEADVQEDLFSHFLSRNQHWVREMSVDDVEKETASFLRVLAKAPFDICECELCPKHSGRDPGLWADSEAEAIGKKARCTDPKCWAAKEREARQAEFARLAAEHKGLVAVDLLKDNSAYQETQKLKDIYGKAYVGGPAHYGSEKYEVVPEGTRDAVTALVVAGPKAGKVVTVKHVGNAAASSKPKKSKAESDAKKRERALYETLMAILRKRLAAITVEQILERTSLLSGLLFSTVYHGGTGIESWGKAREEFLAAWTPIGRVDDQVRELWKRLCDQVRAHVSEFVFSSDRAPRLDAEDLRDLRVTVNAFGWDYDSLMEDAKMQLVLEEDLAQRTEIVKVETPKKSDCSCELRILEDGGKWYGGYAVSLPKVSVDLPADTLGDAYETKTAAVQSMAEAAAKWLAEQKAAKKCPVVLYKPLATAIAEVVGACGLQRDRSFEQRLLDDETAGPAPADADSDGASHASPVRDSGVIEAPELIQVPLDAAWKAKITIKIGRPLPMATGWFAGYEAHVPGAADSFPCSTANTEYASRDEAIVAATSRITGWLHDKPGKRGYRYHADIAARLGEMAGKHILARAQEQPPVMRCTFPLPAREPIAEPKKGQRKCRVCKKTSPECTHCAGTVCPTCQWEEADLCAKCAAAGKG